MIKFLGHFINNHDAVPPSGVRGRNPAEAEDEFRRCLTAIREVVQRRLNPAEAEDGFRRTKDFPLS